MLPFRARLSLDQRRREFERIRSYRDARIPVILEANGRDTPRVDKEKFLVPFDLTIAQLTFVVRKRMRMDASTAIFLLVDGRLAVASTTVRDLYDRHASEDGFLYVVYTTENTFG